MYKHVKYALDIFFALTGMILLSPLFLLLAIIIKCTSPGPVFFSQKRVGHAKRVFTIYKFRTMRIDTPKLPPNRFHEADKYITPVGRVLRKTSLDELPQLYNILIGDMSFIGPRPGAAKNEESLIVLRDKYDVFSVRPGISGWAQVNGRDELAHDEEKKAKADGEYVKKLSLGMDLKCLLMTVTTVIFATGYMEGSNGKSGQSSERKTHP